MFKTGKKTLGNIQYLYLDHNECMNGLIYIYEENAKPY